MTAFFFMPFDDVFERPAFGAAPHHRARCSASPCSSPCSSPCGGLFKLAFTLLMLPTLVRLEIFLMAAFSAALMQGLFAFAVVASVSMLVRSSSAGLSEHVSSCPTGPCRRRRAHGGVDTSKDPENETEPRRNMLDLSSVQLVSRDDNEGALMTLVVAAPGVRAADLSVSAVDRYLHIKGESTKGPETFFIDRCILVPQGADMDAISATHDTDGTLTLVIKRKVPKRVEVVAGIAREAAAKGVQPAEGLHDPSAAVAAAAVAAADDGRELGRETPAVDLDEWER